MLPRFDLIVLDEAHHALAGQWLELINDQAEAYLLGVTATPERLDGRGLGIAAGGVFEHMVTGASVSELIALGFLVPARVFAPPVAVDLRGVRIVAGDYAPGELGKRMDQVRITGDAVDHYQRHAAGLPCLVFCSSVAHAEHVASAFREAGWRAVAAHGGMRAADRDAAIGGLGTGAIQVLTCCDLISEGLDVPAVGAVSLLRPTQSLGLHVQQVGRGLRPAPGKGHLIVLDHVGNTLRHGLPDHVHQWSLAGRDRKQDARQQLWRCPECDQLQRPAPACQECGFTRPVADPAEPLAVAPGDLEEIETDRLLHLRNAPLPTLLRQGMTRDEVEQIRRAKGYKPGWAWITWNELCGRAAASTASGPPT